ncbi:MAG: hypothetical protein COY40_06455 [Alphaproteobacteria bacterium CG_4_10_14_0_8_um_filter_53_9]|nr:MAG: hypothetical protein COY40_06455 [Alphaproteobacteria bacterium CG_4_10_14_0_8_um_filter_53_9]
MTVPKKTVSEHFWSGMTVPALIAILLAVGVVIWVLGNLQAALAPFIIGFVLAYILQPFAGWTERMKMGRVPGALLGLLVFMVVFVGLVAMWVPLLIGQIKAFVGRLPDYAVRVQGHAQPWLDTQVWGRDLTSMMKGFDMQDILSKLTDLSSSAATMGLSVGQGVLGGLMGFAGVVTLFVFALVVAFYMLIDWRRLMSSAEHLLPESWRPEVRHVAHDIDTKLAAYLRGQMLVCLVLAAYYGLALTFMGLELGWMIGLVTGVLAFIPMLGATIGAMMMLVMAAVQFQLSSFEPYLIVAVIFVVGQLLEGYLLTPYLVGRQVGLHPLWVMFALLAGGVLGGFIGMLIALPVAVILAVILPRMLALWRAAIEERN